MTSANLTEYALEGNMELGLVVRESQAAREIERHFDNVVACGTVRKVEG